MAKRYVVLLLELDTAMLKECGLANKQFEELPQTLAKQVAKIAPRAVKPTGLYFLSEKEIKRIEGTLTEHALDFDEVVLSYNTPVKQKKAPVECTVIHLESHRRKQHPGPHKN